MNSFNTNKTELTVYTKMKSADILVDNRVPLYIPPEIWENIISYIRYDIKCEKCGEIYCNKCLDNRHFYCDTCSKFMCNRMDACTKCVHCPKYMCDNNECFKMRIIRKNGVTYTRFGCTECLDDHEKKIMEWDSI
jgi:hypothetical protein